jgi:hypothetical protein
VIAFLLAPGRLPHDLQEAGGFGEIVIGIEVGAAIAVVRRRQARPDRSALRHS